MSSSGEGYRCMVCNETFESRESWSIHLFSFRHQSEARIECLKWKPIERSNAVVVYSSVSLGQADKLLKYFSCEENGKITNFIWWPDRESIGVLVFESPEKVDHFFQTMKGHRLRLPDCVVEFKNAAACLDLEWSQLIHKDLLLKDEPPISNESTLIEAAASEMDCVPDENPMQLLHDDQEASGVINANTNLNDGDGGSNGVLELDCGVIVPSCSFYTSQFLQLFKSVKISRERFEIVNYIRTVLGPEYEVNMYRNGYLGFGMSELDSLLLHVYISKPDMPEGFMKAEEEVVQLVHQRISTEIRKARFLQGYSREEGKLVYSNPLTGISFSVKTDALLIVEVQMCRLIEYYCTFDARVKALLGLVYYWAKENEVWISPPEQIFNLEHSNVPGPASLDWLVILFLCKSGILPTVREIQERPHRPIIVRDDQGESHDVGFEADPNFVEEWKENNLQTSYVGQLDNELADKFIFDVLGLMKDFVEFFLPFKYGGWVLNPRDAEVYDLNQFLEEEPGKTWSTKLSNDEVFWIRYWNDKNRFPMQESCLTMLHPFVVTWRLAISQEMIQFTAKEVLKQTRYFLGVFMKELTKIRKHNKKKVFQFRDILVHVERSSKKRRRELLSNSGDDSIMGPSTKKQKSNIVHVNFATEGRTSNFKFNFMQNEKSQLPESHEPYHDHVDIPATASPRMMITSESIFEGRDCIPLDCGVFISRSPCSPLTSQLIHIIQSIKFSKKKSDVLALIRKSLGAEYVVCLYRNWYLKLGMSVNDPLMLHVYIHSPNNSDGFVNANIETVRKQLEIQMEKEGVQLGGQGDLNVSGYSNSISGVSFSIETDPSVMAEVQTSRLAEYLCTFDPRVRVMLGLVYFWVKENDVCISPQDSPRDPLAWDWLVILFLCKSGVIPTVGEILDRPHKPIIVTCSDGSTHDVGFDADPAFADEWRRKGASLSYEGQLDIELSENFVMEILSLMRYFIDFVRKIKSGNWVLNPRDAEMHDHRRFWNDEPGTTWHTKLTNDEIHKIRQFSNGGRLDKKRFHLTMMHPLVLTLRIVLSPEVLKDKDGTAKVLQFTYSRLTNFLTKSDTGKSESLRTVLVWAGKFLEKRNKKKEKKLAKRNGDSMN